MTDEVSSPNEKAKVGYREGYWGQPLSEKKDTLSNRIINKMLSVVDTPATFWREKVVEPNRKKDFYYYHQKFRRVPTIDECFVDDMACIHEANEQYHRDRKVENAILEILRMRFYQCLYYHGVTQSAKCDALKKDYKEAELNWFIKYGDMNPLISSVIDAYMKQKHRMIMERRQEEKQKQKSN